MVAAGAKLGQEKERLEQGEIEVVPMKSNDLKAIFYNKTKLHVNWQVIETWSTRSTVRTEIEQSKDKYYMINSEQIEKDSAMRELMR